MHQLLDQIHDEEAQTEDELRNGNAVADGRDFFACLQVHDALTYLRLQVDEGGEKKDAATEA